MGNPYHWLAQSIFIPKPPLTEANLPDQAGRVFIVTGGYSGCGEALATILYGANGTVYVAGRAPDKAADALQRIKAARPASRGKVEFLQLDLSDLASIKPAVDAFLAKEDRLDTLTNNAGVMFPSRNIRSAQDYEMQIATNCLGPFLLTQLLAPILTATARRSPPGSVRVTWAGSIGIDLMSPPGGMSLDAAEPGKTREISRHVDYGQSKTGNLFLAREAARAWGNDAGVLHLCWNPGNLKTGLQRHTFGGFLMDPILYPARFGAYTELYAGWAPELTLADAGSFIIPWGRKGYFRGDIANALKPTAEGGSGKAAAFWGWCTKVTKEFGGAADAAPGQAKL